MISSMGLQVQPGYSMTICNFGKQKATLEEFPYSFRAQDLNLEAAI